jgi:prepilin-type processing-associated H-X9-DG protein
MTTAEPIVHVVDDDPSFLVALTRLLRASGYSVRTHNSPVEFLKESSGDSPGCVVLDLQMPGLNGLELQEAIAKWENPLPIVFLTGYGEVPDAVHAIRHGAEDFLSKRASKEELLDAIKRALARDVEERKQRVRQRDLRRLFTTLTEREREVLAHVVQGQLNKQIAGDLELNERTVKLHRTAITTKLGVKSVAELMQLLHEADLIKDGQLVGKQAVDIPHAMPNGFALVELVLVLAVVTVLVTVFLWAQSTLRVRAQAVACLSNKRLLGLAWAMYSQDHDGKLADSFNWVVGELDYVADNPFNTNINILLTGELGPYVKQPAAYKCPADQSTAVEGTQIFSRVRTTSMNQMIRPAANTNGWTASPPWRIYKRMADIAFPAPANLWVLIDENPDSVNDAAFAMVMDRQKWGACWQDGPNILHGGSASISFADAHAEIRRWRDPQTLTMQVTYRMEFPYGQVQPYNIDVQWIQDRTTAWQ